MGIDLLVEIHFSLVKLKSMGLFYVQKYFFYCCDNNLLVI
jgi:hypothetical protein